MPNTQVEAIANCSIRRLTPAHLDRVCFEMIREISGQSRRGFFVNRLAASCNEPGGFISLAYIENGVVEGNRACLGHDPGAYHPECPDRLRAVLRALEHAEFRRPAARGGAARHHRAARARPSRRDYVEAILAIRPEGDGARRSSTPTP